MDPRSVAHALSQIADFIELKNENRFKSAAYRNAARAILSVQTDDLAPFVASGELAELKGIGPATLSTIRELVESGESRYLEQLRAETPEGLLEMLGVPGLGTAKIQKIHEGLGVSTLAELEAAASDGRLAKLPRFGAGTAAKIVKGIAYLRQNSAYMLYPRALAESEHMLAAVVAHPAVERAMLAGSLRRRNEIVRDIDVVASCSEAPEGVAASFASAPGVRDAEMRGEGAATVHFVDGSVLDLHCVTPERYAMAEWRATGSESHVSDVAAHAAARGMHLDGDELRDSEGTRVAVGDERALYRALGLTYIEPELREGRGEVAAAAAGALPTLIQAADIRGVLHCHSDFSDGKATIAEMAEAARVLGWTYIGISDHSQSAFYAGGLKPEAVIAQHAEIDLLNSRDLGIRILKGVEADILADGQIDYDQLLLDRFDYVIASVHSRFSMDRETMTARVLRALDDPHVTILGHPTGRLLLSREAYAIDMEAVIAKAAAKGVAIEINADPHRLDLDWRHCQLAKSLGCSFEIGPDAHSTRGLQNMEFGVGIARKGWLEARDVLNTLSAEEIVERLRMRRKG
ncbi:MAG: DNA polymerase/3'-5' exonuclease PolX [Gemmatimonadaceae bacterium]|nr:DNA polymerase/3'-5' exonuclease PolX [Gemmatimonadaceae bacterium]